MTQLHDRDVDLRQISRDQQRNRNRGAHNRRGGVTTSGELRKRSQRRARKRSLVQWVQGMMR